MAWFWLIYGLLMLAISTLVGWHLGRFRDAYTEMTGMMVGMTMGMMTGFVLGYAAGAALADLAWGNFLGVLLGLSLGVFYGRAGGVMGMMDGGMGGVMGGSMGAMIALMLYFPPERLYWTGALFGVVFLVSMVGLVALMEQASPEHAAFHRLMPVFARVIRTEAAEEREAASQAATSTGSGVPLMIDYYSLLGIEQSASADAIGDAYLAKLSTAEGEDIRRTEQAYATLSNSTRRAIYDRRLQESLAANDGRATCCPPPRKKKTPLASDMAAQVATSVAATQAAPPVPARRATASAPAPAPAVLADAAPAARQFRTRAQTTVRSSAVQAQPAPAPARSGQQRAKNATPARRQGQSNRQRSKQAVRQKEAPISWVGVVAGGVLVVLLVTWWMLSQAGGNGGATKAAAAPSQDTNQLIAQLEPKAVAAPVGADGKQTLDLVVDGNTFTYSPSVIKVKQGVPVHFNLKTAPGRDPGCARLVIFRGLSVHAVAKPGEVVPVDFTPTQPGAYEMNCGMNMMQPGYVIVQ